ncbi:YicC/YloC family endoribonuclease [Fulvivirga sedimenti]|uniref:YicC family protein n=1 Tax=Fulvivirga sedimenti TaxID=2879465 RepID=A0A9X1HVE8_9BACT|nr:YicC/YloC family endoribonuclease [Fulvivirga sedimenti]MCA6078999.1 YicC family protein [Fulvivirga sedimenti]
MLKSMTGYGSVHQHGEGLAVHVELKTLNSKFLDLNVRMPHELYDQEATIKRLVSDRLVRGKVMLNIDIVQEEDPEPSQGYNATLFKKYYNKLRELAELVGDRGDDLFRLALESPDVIINQEEHPFSEAQLNLILGAVDRAIDQCDSFRKEEGNRLRDELRQYGLVIKQNLEALAAIDPDRIERIGTRIKNNISRLVEEEGLDENRLEQELVYYIEKLDITEEKVRLFSHIDFFLETLESNENSGKKLGFISQEMGREINTIGSKANDASIQKHVVAMKEELEKIKEQVLNIV